MRSRTLLLLAAFLAAPGVPAAADDSPTVQAGKRAVGDLLARAAKLVRRKKAARTEVEQLRKTLAEDVHRGALADERWIDLHLALDALDRRLDREPHAPDEAWEPPAWIDELPSGADAVGRLTSKEFDALEARLDGIRVPPGRAGSEGRKRLVRTGRRLRRFVDEADAVADARTGTDRTSALAAASAADDLADDLSHRRSAGGPIGAERYAWTLRMGHRLPWDAAALRKMALALRKRAIEQLEAHARKHGDGKTWRELAREEKRLQPKDAATLLALCRNDVDESVGLLRASGVVTVSDPGALKVDWMRRGVHHPFAMYQPRPSRRGFTGSYLVSRPPDEPRGDPDFPEYGSVHWMRVVSVHEAYPGHHLQHAIAARNRSIWRRYGYGYTTVFVEGWGFYCESLMDRLGFFEDPMTQIALLRMRLWRAERALADVAVHTGAQRPSAAVARLEREVLLSYREASSEVRTRRDWPTHGISYMAGARLIEELRAAYLAEHGKDREREFHDRLLGFGPIRLDLVRAVLLGERSQFDARRP